jgi:hypothetical protein
MRLSDVPWARRELPADGLPASDRGSPSTALADQPDLAARPRPDRPGRDQPTGSRGLAERLARLPDAHPSAWTGAARSAAEQASMDRASARNGEPPSEHTWWRGESDIWWRIPDRSAGEADGDDDAGGLDDPGELAGSGDRADDADAPAGADRAADADATGETGDQGGGTGGRGARGAGPAPGSAGPDHGTRDRHWGGAGVVEPGQSGPDRGHYRPWFSADALGDPWFAAGRQDWADS